MSLPSHITVLIDLLVGPVCFADSCFLVPEFFFGGLAYTFNSFGFGFAPTCQLSCKSRRSCGDLRGKEEGGKRDGEGRGRTDSVDLVLGLYTRSDPDRWSYHHDGRRRWLTSCLDM
jgi:hypothetical protein